MDKENQTRHHAWKIERSIRRRRSTVALFAYAALLVVLGVALALRQNGRAATVQRRVLDCPVTGTVAHHHDESCYDEQGNLVCTLPEVECHVHDDSCYEEQAVLVCAWRRARGTPTPTSAMRPCARSSAARRRSPITFDDLAEGYYEVRETKLPEGYINAGQAACYIKVSAGTVVLVEKGNSGWKEVASADEGKYTYVAASGQALASIAVENVPGAELPAAGGPGNAVCNILGAMVISAVVFTRLLRRLGAVRS